MKTHWKVILGIFGAILPSFFTYLAARSESNEAKIRAEVAYVTMQDVVKELQTASYQHALQIAKLEGQLEAEKRNHDTIATAKPTGVGKPPMRPTRGVDGDGVPESPAPVKLAAPPDFGQAVREYKAKK